MVAFDVLDVLFGIKHTMINLMNLTESGAKKAADVILKQFAEVSALLQKHPYLGSGSGATTFGAADLAWSALVGWLVLPGPNFHRGLVNLPKDIADWPVEYRQLHKALRDTTAGRHCLKCYHQHRSCDAQGSSKNLQSSKMA
eukprot:gnl/MRDRNA2_/MRDRNA2_291860_c0_seq1.p1 gnl/MRDRNA2_/MRDRNA2_291860_c0~~gnl/MRDRNA2_/MRDRNA2_291860_c0_seq1.p1  ORF type:complete len:142 (-),score=18.93 gnl/MRDRNA2_/MRDRNA2_291860_c0_seq1:113-538(-)